MSGERPQTGEPGPILVTGATGFTGRHLARALLARGDRVRCIVRDPGSARDLEGQGAELVVADLGRECDFAAMTAGCSAIFHLAAVVRTVAVPDVVVRRIHAGAAERMLEASASRPVPFVLCSTVGIYGSGSPNPVDESAPASPRNVYEQTKWEAEEGARRVAEQTGTPLVVLRPAAIYGPGDRRLLKFFRLVRMGLMIGPGETLIHPVHVSDVVDAHLLALDKARGEARGRAYNVAGAHPLSLNEMARMVAVALGTPGKRIRHLPLLTFSAPARICAAACTPLGIEPPLHPRRLEFFTNSRSYDTLKAQRELGFRERVPLEDGLRETVEAYRRAGWLA